MIEQLILGFHAALTLNNLLFIFCGIALGIIFGVLPGLGSVTAIAIMIPVVKGNLHECVLCGHRQKKRVTA